jgi:hypothetical protein
MHSSHFSQQRKWLEDIFGMSTDQDQYQKQKSFVKYLGEYAEFYKDVWFDYDGENNELLAKIKSSKEAELASVLLLFLKESNHKMAITILANFYKKIIRGEEGSISEFIEATKAITAFYVFWRSTKSNAGLDNSYRSFFRGLEDEDGNELIAPQRWKEKGSIELSIKDLKQYFLTILDKENIATENDWKAKALNELNYSSSKKVCKLALFIAAHETIPDETIPGKIKIARSGTKKYLTVERWKSPDLKTIEHIAPQKPESATWDERLYGEDELFNSIGNLTLLPTKVNTSASNKPWELKKLYCIFRSV